MSGSKKDVVIVTGSDAKMASLMIQAIRSLIRLGLHEEADIAAFDLGLTEAQRTTFSNLGLTLKAPTWEDGLEKFAKAHHQIGLIARVRLREYFPGYGVYLWFDADAWAQTDEFFFAFVTGAREQGAAVVREDGVGYKQGWRCRKWWIGNMVAAYGLKGIAPLLLPAINCGVFALAKDAPHWNFWIEHYRNAMEKRRRLNLDQHAFNFAVAVQRLSVQQLPARMNWQPSLSAPAYDVARNLLVEPRSNGQPISVVHLTGEDKHRAFILATTNKSEVTTSMTFGNFF